MPPKYRLTLQSRYVVAQRGRDVISGRISGWVTPDGAPRYPIIGVNAALKGYSYSYFDTSAEAHAYLKALQ